jgi:excisionase family DNA binding protein
MTSQATTQTYRFKPLMSTAELAHYLSVPRESLYAWRARGEGPRWYRVGRSVRYRPEDVEAWIEQQREAERASGANP